MEQESLRGLTAFNSPLGIVFTATDDSYDTSAMTEWQLVDTNTVIGHSSKVKVSKAMQC